MKAQGALMSLSEPYRDGAVSRAHTIAGISAKMAI